MKVRNLAAMLMCATAVLAGCASNGEHVQAVNNAAADCAAVDVSRVKSYESLSELAADSAIVVLGQVEPGATLVSQAGDGATVREYEQVPIQLVKTLKGSAPDTLKLHTVTSSCPGSDLPPRLETGVQYVLFLVPFEWKPGNPTDEWTLLGGAGIYQVGEGRPTLTLVSPSDVDSLPLELPDLAALSSRI